MKKLLTAVATAAALATPMAHAQANDFEGFSVGLGVTSADTTSEVVTGTSSSASNTDNNAVLQLQYNMAVNNTFVVGFGGTANVGDLRAGTFGPNQNKLKDGYSLYLAPGYAFSKGWMGYVKLAYLNASLQNSAGRSLSFDNGWGYGIGVQALFGKNWFGQAEYMADQYNDRSGMPGETDKLKSNILALTVGYRF
jgi:opacity protein-like surface antigen